MAKKTWVCVGVALVGLNVAINVVAHVAFTPRLKALQESEDGLTEQQLIEAGPAGPCGVFAKFSMLSIRQLTARGFLIRSEVDGETHYRIEPEFQEKLSHAWPKAATA
jgi:hypothetical protein